MVQLKKTIVSIDIPAIEETLEGKLRGGFAAFSMEGARNNDDNTRCENNIECSGNTDCYDNQTCNGNTGCSGNLTTTTTPTKDPTIVLLNPWCSF